MREKDPDNEIREAFRVFDAEGSGYIGQRGNAHKIYINSKCLEAEELRDIFLQMPGQLSDEEPFLVQDHVKADLLHDEMLSSSDYL